MCPASESVMVMNDASKLASVLPRVLIVSRRTVRKNKFVDFVGEYHLDLIVNYGAVPVIVPRVPGVELMLESFEPIHGVLLCEGEDVDPSLYDNELWGFSSEELEEIMRLHSSDTTIDRSKDSIEMQLARRCVERNIPYLGICRGSQVLNVACGGTLYQDVETELFKQSGVKVSHLNYDDYDGHRHPIKVVEDTPLQEWFESSLKGNCVDHLLVNSYHHQGVKKLANRFKPMAFSQDGLIEAFYDLDDYNPEEGKFIVGLQFHPERMRRHQDLNQTDENGWLKFSFDYPGCPRVYEEFVKAVVAYQKKLMAPTREGEMEKQRKNILGTHSAAKALYDDQTQMQKRSTETNTNSDQIPGGLLLQLSVEEEKRLKHLGATVRNSMSYLAKLRMDEERRKAARRVMAAMSTQQLSELLDLHGIILEIGYDILKTKLAS
uniref:Uncharacterized protein n=1 Tax=Picea sitchensis TaxID=3332 RepID=A9P280_PICSI|nr:unknown [Picea sitchensis]